LFKSLKGDNSLVVKRKTFGSTDSINIILLDENNKKIQFKNSKWNKQFNNIEIFDTFFIESNVYLITLGNYDKPSAFFEIVVGNSGVELAEKIVKLRTERKKISSNKRSCKNLIKKTDDQKDIANLKRRIAKGILRKQYIQDEILKLEKELTVVAEDFGKDYLDKINTYLRYFNPNIQLTKLNKKGSRFVYFLRIQDFDVRSDSESVSLKHSLSEGDKSSLALSFFLARLSLQHNLSEKIIIFDDPISSFDYTRRSVTINQLHNFSKKTKQFILLSHDMNFIKDFSDKCQTCLNLKIIFKGGSSVLENHNIHKDTLTGIFKDLTVLHDFIENGESSEFDNREVVRCIRPSIEGIFRIKFFKSFKNNEWLGDMINAIRISEINSRFYHLKPMLEELEDINDYSKTYHHSNPNYLETQINTEELRIYGQRTLKLIERI